MKIIKGIAVNDTILTSNVPETDFTAWAVGTTYALDATVFIPTTHDVYRSLINGNVGNDPTLEVQWDAANPPTRWQLIGKTNKYKMFDELNLSQTARADNINITLALTGRYQAISLLNLDAKSVVVTATSGALGVVYNQTFDLRGNNTGANYWDYFFSQAEYSTTLNILDLPNYANLSVNIQIINTGFTAKCGNCIVGKITDIGSEPQYGLSIGLVDYSTIVRYFDGTQTIIRRTSAKLMELTNYVQKDDCETAINNLQAFLGLPVLCIGATERKETVVYGILKDVRYSIDYPTESVLNLKMDGFI